MGSLEDRLAALERRVEQLEAGSSVPDVPGAPGGPPSERREATAPPEPLTDGGVGRLGSEGALRLLEGVREGVGGAGASGRVVYVGAVGFDGREYLWAKEHQVGDLVGTDQVGAAAMLECLGSAARLALLIVLAERPRGRGELQEALGETSTGHLYHHLRELQGAGLIVQRRRGEYELASHALVPLLAVIAATRDLMVNADRVAEDGR
ncbi:hypothetical protein ABGB17_10475 [Sphaerisporangium sp. B11E5]|uniref:ArsR/SmtB family transcription factor n=1 Tax=Sphaerisporangium sp. B11E5 TaxID=3153563 RepID=UPI00325DA7DE